MRTAPKRAALEAEHAALAAEMAALEADTERARWRAALYGADAAWRRVFTDGVVPEPV